MEISHSANITDDVFNLALNSNIYKRWVNNLVSNFDVRGIKIRDVVLFGSRVGFIFAEADCYLNNKKVPGVAFLRGDSVSIMPIFDIDGEKYTAIVTEPRVPIGVANQPSLPAGMIDDGTFHSAAIKELEEEVGAEIKITTNDLIELGKFPLSCGGCDEYMTLMAFECNLSKELASKLDGRITGCPTENEQIKVNIIPLDDLIKLNGLDARSTLSYYLWKNRT